MNFYDELRKQALVTDIESFIREKWTSLYTIYSLIGLFCVFSTISYRKLRPLFPINVQCWFCGESNRVLHDNRNQFECRYCEQYNGFGKDGDYNKDIPSQRFEFMNHFPEFHGKSRKKLHLYHNGLCQLCNTRQEKKISLRNGFIANNSLTEDEEFEAYCKWLEQTFRLCTLCQQHTESRLSFQDAKILPHLMKFRSSSFINRLHKLTSSHPAAFVVYSLSALTYIVPESYEILPLVPGIFFSLVNIAGNSSYYVAVTARMIVIFSRYSSQPIDSILVQLCDISFVLSVSYCVLLSSQKYFRSFFGTKRTNGKFSTTLPNLNKALAPQLDQSFLESRVDSLSIGRGFASEKSRKSASVFCDNCSAYSLQPSKFMSSFEDCTPNSSQPSSIGSGRLSFRSSLSNAARMKATENWLRDVPGTFVFGNGSLPKSFRSSQSIMTLNDGPNLSLFGKSQPSSQSPTENGGSRNCRTSWNSFESELRSSLSFSRA